MSGSKPVVLIDTERLPEEGNWRWCPADPRRGTEEFYTATARELTARGNTVVVRYDGPDADVDGVVYVPRERDVSFAFDVSLACNQDPRTAGEYERRCAPEGQRVVWWTNKYGQTYADVVRGGGGPDAYVVISNYHRLAFGRGAVIGHGCDHERLPRPAAKAPIAAYTSSPDRGLDFLRGVWPEIEKATGVRLVATDGSMTNAEVDNLYTAAKFWVHPGLGVELFCISALKAQVAGCIPIVVPHMALEETVRFGCKTDLWRFAEAAIETIRGASSVTVPHASDFPTWASVTADLAAVLGVK